MNFSFWPFLWFGLPGRLLISMLQKHYNLKGKCPRLTRKIIQNWEINGRRTDGSIFTHVHPPAPLKIPSGNKTGGEGYLLSPWKLYLGPTVVIGRSLLTVEAFLFTVESVTQPNQQRSKIASGKTVKRKASADVGDPCFLGPRHLMVFIITRGLEGIISTF